MSKIGFTSLLDFCSVASIEKKTSAAEGRIERFVLGATPNPNVGSGESHANHDGRGCMRITRSSVNMKGKTIHYCASGTTISENINGTDVTRNSCENRLHFVIMCCQVDGYQITGDTIAHLGNIVLYYKDP